MIKDWDDIARTIGYPTEKDMLEGFYLREGLSIPQIAAKLGTGPATIHGRMGRYEIVSRGRGGANNNHRYAKMLHHLDQRRVFLTHDQKLASLLGCHRSSVYKYKRGVVSVEKAPIESKGI